MMVEIKEGPELDRAVAEIVGWEVVESSPWERWDDPPRIRDLGVSETGDVLWIGAGPSTDLNAAFAAAEKAGLFSNGSVYLTRDIHGEWFIVKRTHDKVFGTSTTPALAICAAILALREA